jgi:3-deoxy-D-manno-octulosonic-acid transferase
LISMKKRYALCQRMALGLYQLGMLLAQPMVLVGLLWRGFRQPSYWQNFKQRWGWIDVMPQGWGGILVHAASLGEVHAARPVIDRLLERYPGRMLTVSCQTPTGLAQVQKQWAGAVRAVYLPLDTHGACYRFLSRLQPRLIVLLEREIWPNLLHACEMRVIPVVLINARLSERSARLCRKLSWLMAPALGVLRAIHAADKQSAERLVACGAKVDVVRWGGNLKFDVPVQPSWTEATIRATGWESQRPIVLLASSHDGEEAQALAQWASFVASKPQALLVIVPRHPHRFEQVAQLIEQHGLSYSRRSHQKPMDPADQILLVDTMGELQQWYRLATVCAIAGSWANVGGHNALEALRVGRPVLFGPHTHNFEALYEEIEQAGAGERIASISDLMTRAMHWLNNPALLKQYSLAASTWVQSHQGSSERAMEHLLPMLPSVLAETRLHHQDRGTVWQHPTRLGQTVVPWGQDSPLTTTSDLATLRGGRGQAKLFKGQHAAYVLRHNHRGGLVGKVLGDRYLRTQAYDSRSLQEFYLLSLMEAWNLPVPQVAAARHESGLIFDRCDIVTCYVADSMSLHALLCQENVDIHLWSAIGSMIAQFHRHQIDHVDLNCHNILLQRIHEESTVPWAPLLIDFDKCRLRDGDGWKSSNLERLQRSLRKEKRLRANLNWQEEQWQALMQAYTAF